MDDPTELLSPPSGGATATAPIGVVLAGGRAQRMGRDKAKLAWAGTTLTGWAAERFARLGLEVLVADGGRRLLAGLTSVADAHHPSGARSGPAGGILGAAAARPRRPLLVLACDLPQVPVAFLARLLSEARSSGADVVLPRSSSGLEPLVAIYGPAALDRLAAMGPDAGPHRLASAPGLDVLILALDNDRTLAAAGLPVDCFANLNTPEELAALESRG